MADLDRPDDELIDSARNGDESAFESLMRRHAETIRRLIARYFRNRSMVDDLAQETFAKAYFSLNSFRSESPFVYWLKRIAVRLCIDEMRRRKSEGAANQADAASILDDPAPEDSEKRLEASLLLDKMLTALSPLDRMIVVLFYGEGYDSNEIADLTGLSRTNIKVRAFRVRRRLKALYSGGLV